MVSRFPELTFIFRQIVSLAERGHHITVATRSRGSWRHFQADLPLSNNIRVLYLPPDVNLSNPKRLLQMIGGITYHLLRSPREAFDLLRRDMSRREFIRYLPLLSLRPDVIQFDFPMKAVLYPRLGALLNAPTVVSCQGSDVHLLFLQPESVQNSRLKVLHSATVLQCVSEALAAEVQHLTGRTDPIWVNRPAVPVRKITPKTHYQPQAPPLIVAVGRLTWIKGFDYLLAALARLQAAGVPFQAQIVGGGELYAPLRFSIDDLRLGERVKLVGTLPSDAVIDLLRRADLFVLTSHNEGVSNAALEAMACGLPIVTTAAGGMPEAVRDDVDGYVVPVRDIDALADRIGRLLAAAPLRERMGRAARVQVEAAFSVERQALVFEQIYQAAIDAAKQT